MRHRVRPKAESDKEGITPGMAVFVQFVRRGRQIEAETGNAGRGVDCRGRRGTGAEKPKRFRFSFRFNHQRSQTTNAEGKLTSGDRSRKLALDMSLDQQLRVNQG